MNLNTTPFNPVPIADAVETLNRRLIRQPDGRNFGCRFFDSTCRFFEEERAAVSINVPALFHLDGLDYPGIVTVGRDGKLVCRLTHEE